MRKLLLVFLATYAFAQQPRVIRPLGPFANSAEMAIKQASEMLGDRKKVFDRDLEVLSHLRIAENALVDPMQPENALQKAYEEVDKAKSLQPEFVVMQGVIKAERELEEARRSPATANFERLRAMLREQALGPAVRVVAAQSLRLQEETLAWLRVQEMISAHVRAMAEITGEGMRAAQGEK